MQRDGSYRRAKGLSRRRSPRRPKADISEFATHWVVERRKMQRTLEVGINSDETPSHSKALRAKLSAAPSLGQLTS